MLSASGAHGPNSGTSGGEYARWLAVQDGLACEKARKASVKARVNALQKSVDDNELEFVELNMLGREELKFVQHKSPPGIHSVTDAVAGAVSSTAAAIQNTWGAVCSLVVPRSPSPPPQQQKPQQKKGLGALSSVVDEEAPAHERVCSPRRTEQRQLREARLKQWVSEQEHARPCPVEVWTRGC